MFKNTNIFHSLLFLLFLFVPHNIYAKSSLIDINCTVGFNNVFTLKTWSPITIKISNKGKHIDGELEVIATSGSEYQKTINTIKHRQKLEIASRSEKYFSTTVKINTYAHPLIINLYQSGKLVVSKSINLRPFYTEKKLFLSLSNKLSSDIIKNPDLNLKNILTHARYLPESWYGYDAVENIFLHPNYLRNLSNQQFSAFKKWLFNGGQLIISGSYNRGALASNRMKQLIAIQFNSTIKANSLKSLTRFIQADIPGKKTFLLLNHKIDKAEVVLENSNIPIIQKIQYGLGYILYVSLDLQENPFRNWKNKHQLWEKLVTLFPPPKKTEQFNDEALISTMISAMKARYPSGLFLFIYLFSFLCLVTFFVKKINEKKQYQKKFFAMLIGIFSLYVSGGLLGYYHFVKINLFTYSTFTSVFLDGNNQLAKAVQTAGFFSLDKSSQVFELKNGPNPISIVLQERNRSDIKFDTNLEENKDRQHINLNLNKWSYKIYKTETAIKIPLKADVQNNPDDLSINILNSTPYNIEDCYIFYNNRFIKITDISKKKSVTILLSHKTILNKPEYMLQEGKLNIRVITDGEIASLKDKNISFQLEELQYIIYKRYKNRTDQIHFFGWINQAVVESEILNNAIEHDKVTLLEWDIPIT